jgi:Protein of unknown function (DUF1559)
MLLSAIGRRRGRAGLWLLVGLLIGGVVGAGAVYVWKRGKNGIPGGPRLGPADELAMVPPDSIGFIHVRARDIWKSEHLEQFRKAIEKAGPDSLKMLDEGFVPAPSTLDRLTLVFLKADETPQPKNPKGPQPFPQPNEFPRDRGPGFLPPDIDLPFNPPAEAGEPVVILAFDSPFDASKVRSTYMPTGLRKTIYGKEVWLDKAADRSRDLGLYFPSESIMVFGTAAAVEKFVSKQRDGKQPDGPLSSSLRIAAEGGRHMIAGINLKHFGLPDQKVFDRAKDDVKEIENELRTLMKAEALAIGLGFNSDGTKLDVRAAYRSEQDAAEAEAAVRSVATFLRKKLDEPKKEMKKLLEGKPGQSKPRPIKDLPEAVLGLFGTGALNMVDDNLANPPVKVEGNELVATFDMNTIGGAYVGAAAVGVGLLLPATQKVREAAARMQGSNNLKQIGLAMHNYHDSNSFFPPQDGKTAENTKGGLSWRVHILPYIEQGALHQQFHLDEPWDSAHNKTLIDKMPKTYVSPIAIAPPGETYYKVFVGKGAMFEPGQKINMFSITDGTSNTIMAVEGGEPVIWTKPDDIPFTGKDIDPMSLALPGKPGINFLMGDGSVRYVFLPSLSPQRLKAAITRAGGEIGGLDGPDDAPMPKMPMPKGPPKGPPKPPALEPIKPIKP